MTWIFIGMGIWKNIKESIDDKSSFSVNNVSLLISSVIGFLIGLVICFVLVYDVTTNGYVKTDLTDMGIFLLCSGGYIASSGAPKAIIDSRLNTKAKLMNENLELRAEMRRKEEEERNCKSSEGGES